MLDSEIINYVYQNGLNKQMDYDEIIIDQEILNDAYNRNKQKFDKSYIKKKI